MLSCAHFSHCLLLSFDSPLGKRFVTRPVTEKEKKSVLFILRVHEMNPVISAHHGQIRCQSVWVGINVVNKCDTSATLSRRISPCGGAAALFFRNTAKHLIAFVSPLVSPQMCLLRAQEEEEEEHSAALPPRPLWLCIGWEGGIILGGWRSTLCHAFALTQCASLIKKKPQSSTASL